MKVIDWRIYLINAVFIVAILCGNFDNLNVLAFAEISPEAEKFLENLHKKVVEIESLSWMVESEPLHYTIKNYYKQGGVLRSQIEYHYGAYPFDYFITPEKCLSYTSRTGEISEIPEDTSLIMLSDIWFFLPLLHKNILKGWGEVVVKEELIDKKSYTVLEISSKPDPQTGVESKWKHRFYFTTGELKLKKIEYCYDDSPQMLEVKEYQKVMMYDFPVRVEGDSGGFLVKDIQLNPVLSSDLFKLEDKDTLIYFSQYSEDEINNLLSKKPDDPDLHYTLAKFYQYKKRDNAKAIQGYKKVIALKPNARAGYLGLAALYSASNQKEEAAEIYRGIILKFSDNLYVLLLVASFYQENNKTEEAVELYKRVIDLSPDELSKQRHQLALARIYKQAGRNEEAERLINLILKSEPPKWIKQEAYQLLIEVMRASNRLDELIQSLEEKVKSKPDDIELLETLVNLYSITKQYDKSVAVYKKLIAIKPDKKYYSELAYIYERKQDWGEAIEIYKRLVEIYPQDKNYYSKIAYLYERLDQPYSAVEWYEKLFSKFPESKKDYISHVVQTYKDAGRNKEAIKTAEEHIKENPDKAGAYSIAASLYSSLKQYDKALTMYKKAIELEENPDSKAGYMIMIGRIYTQQNKYKEAEETFEQAKKVCKKEWVNRDVEQEINELYRKAGKVDETIKRYETKLEKNSEDIENLRQLAEIYYREGNYDKAIEFYKKILKVKPDDSNFLNWLAYIYYRTKRYNEAIEIYKKLVSKFPDNMNYLNSLVRTYQESGKNEEAIKIAEECIKKNPNIGRSYSIVADIYRAQQKWDNAIEMYKKALTLESGNFWKIERLMALAGVYMQKGEYGLAEKTILEAKSMNPEADQKRSVADRLADIYKQIDNLEAIVNRHKRILRDSNSTPDEKGVAAYALAMIEKEKALGCIVEAILKYKVDKNFFKDTFCLCDLQKAEEYLSDLFKKEKDQSIREKISQLVKILELEEKKFQGEVSHDD